MTLQQNRGRQAFWVPAYSFDSACFIDFAEFPGRNAGKAEAGGLENCFIDNRGIRHKPDSLLLYSKLFQPDV